VITDIGKDEFNTQFRICPVVRYSGSFYSGGRYTHQNEMHSVYVRTSSVPDGMDAYDYFTQTWNSTNNVLGTDFELYDSLDDARARQDQWGYCNYDDIGVGYPRDCGKTALVGGQWFAMGQSLRSFALFTGAQCESFKVFPANPAATTNPVASSNCGFDAAQGYQSATNGASCFIRDASNTPVVVDYTAFRYTTYSFTMQMLENGQTPIKNNNIFHPHGGIKICNMDGMSQSRGGSPELWFIDHGWSTFGYGLYHGDWGHVSTAEMESVSQGLYPDVPRVWEIVMEWDGASYKLVSWKVDGTAIPNIAGQSSGCGADTSASGQVRVWAWQAPDTFKVKDFTVTQSVPLLPLPSPSPPPSPPPPPSPSPPAPYIFMTKASLRTAVQEYNTNPTAAIVMYGPVADWDVSGITDMSSLFSGLQNFNADISNWDTSSVTTMHGMFYYATVFDQPLSFDTSKVTTMNGMFFGASAFNQPLSFDTSKVTNMYRMRDMFWRAYSLSNANKLLIRCAWAGTSAFASAGYGSSWGPGICA